jgi:hypothetical protein
MVARAKRIWSELVEDVGAIAWIRIHALERAMLSERAFSVDAFTRFWAHHPLMMHLARRVVWSAHGRDERVTTFRVTEDGALADPADDVFELENVASIRIPHPHRWPDETRERWNRLFADYELGQPFAQLDRPLPTVTSDELRSDSIVRAKRGFDDLEGMRRWAAASGFHFGAGWFERATERGQVRLRIGMHQDGRETTGVSLTFRYIVAGEKPTWHDAPSGVLEELLDRFGVPEPG